MFRALSLSVAAAFLAGLAQLRAADSPATPASDSKSPQPAPETGPAAIPKIGEMPIIEISARVFRSVQIVRDLAEFNILNLRPQKAGAWIVARIQPGGLSGGLYIQGGYIKAETGEFVDNGIRPREVVLIGGQWKRLELLSGEAPPEGRFEWKEPYVNHDFDRTFNVYDYYSVFAGSKNDGTVICQFFADRAGAGQFSSVTAIPDDWNTFVKPAYEYHVRHPGDSADSDLNGFRKMASGENPFIALTAIRHILSRATTKEEIDRLVDLARSLPRFRQAVFTFWLLNKNDDKGRDIVLDAISRTNNTAELAGMALGIESWTASQRRIVDVGPGGNLRDKVMERWQSFDPSTADDEPCKPWNKILVAPGIQEVSSTQLDKRFSEKK